MRECNKIKRRLMSAEVGTTVIDVLERAGEQHIMQAAPEFYDEFLWQIHGAGTLRHYDGSDVYWRRIQAALDFFFTAEQRAEICRCLMQQAVLDTRPECRSFRACALAETRMADLIAGMRLAAVSAGPWKRTCARRAWRSLRRRRS
jgi:hypothetical protein